MRRANIIRIFAGSLTLISSLLGYFVNTNWLFVTMFVGLNLFQYGLTDWCPLEKILIRLGVDE